jgi:hypothetical protein
MSGSVDNEKFKDSLEDNFNSFFAATSNSSSSDPWVATSLQTSLKITFSSSSSPEKLRLSSILSAPIDDNHEDRGLKVEFLSVEIVLASILPRLHLPTPQ